MLEAYYERRAAVSASSEDNDDEVLPGGLPNIAYDQHPKFNEELDGQYPLDGKLLYSVALYRLYYEDYVIELENYLDRITEEIEEADEQDNDDPN